MDHILHIRDCLPVPDAKTLAVHTRTMRWRRRAVLSDRGVEYPHRADPACPAICNDAQRADGAEQASENPGIFFYTPRVL